MKTILKRLKKKVKNYLTLDNKILDFEKRIDRESTTQKMLLGTIMSRLVQMSETNTNLQDAEFKVFSQWGDDGIIQFLVNVIAIPQTTFIEFGVENYTESNTRYLLMKNNWSGLVIDGSSANIEYIKNDEIYWKYDLRAQCAFIDAQNINKLISSSGFGKDIGILSIDIDGNDYWIWKAIEHKPIIVIVEYNASFGLRPITIPYDYAFRRSEAHFSHLYYGASLMSLCDLAEEKGYSFIGCNSNGVNAYFVRKDKLGNLNIDTPQTGYRALKFREHRDKKGHLTFSSPQKAIDSIKGMPVYNTQSDTVEII